MNEPFIRRRDRRIMASVTSYEIVCATARKAPIKAYFELEAQPDHRIEYTARLEVARMNRSPIFMLISGYGSGSGIHITRAIVKASVGAMV